MGKGVVQAGEQDIPDLTNEAQDLTFGYDLKEQENISCALQQSRRSFRIVFVVKRIPLKNVKKGSANENFGIHTERAIPLFLKFYSLHIRKW